MRTKMDNLTVSGYIFRVLLAFGFGLFLGWVYL